VESEIMSYIKTLIVPLIIAIALSAVVIGCAGYDLGDLIHVKTPPAARQAFALPSNMSLNEAQAALDQSIAATQSLAESIEGAEVWRGIASGLAMQGISEVATPLGSVGVLLTTLLAGVFIRKPGDVAAKDKESAYNKGVETGKRLAMEATGAIL
jgi:hypothetical protein